MSLEIAEKSRRAIHSNFEEVRSWRLLPELYGCLFIDISWMDMVFAFSCFLSRSKHYHEVYNKVEELLGGSDRILISLSVRSSFDLFLQAMDFPPDSEIISTCINIKQMSDIAKYHGINLKPIDVDLSSLKPNISQIESLITQKTVGIMIVQLFGMKFSTKELNEVAKKHKLVVIEDCAQAFYGPKALQKVESDVAFFSFGSIKRFTCLGGACIVSNNPLIVQKMRHIQNTYKIQGQLEYFFKLLKYVIFLVGMNNPFLAWFLSSLISMLGIDTKVLVKSRLRSFTRGSLMDMIRFRPSMPLLLLLKRRMQALISENNDKSALLRAEYTISSLIEQPTYVVGCLSEVRDFWLFPVLVDNPIEVEYELDKYGISSFAKASSLEFNYKPTKDLKSSQFLCKHVLYLPIDRRVPKWHIDNVCRCLLLVLQSRESIFDLAEQEGVQLKRDVGTLMKHTSEFLCSNEFKNSNEFLYEAV